MRWLWIDRFIEFESGSRAKAVKVVSLSEDHLHDHFTGYVVMPNSLITEGLAQTGGILVGEHNAFKKNVVLAKVPRMQFHLPALPGDRLTYTAEVDYIKEQGAMVRVTSHIEDKLQAEGEIVFAHLDSAKAEKLFEPANFVFTMQLLGVFDVGKTADGKPLERPAGLEEFLAKHKRA